MRVGIIGATGWLGSALGTRLLSLGIVKPSDLIALNRSSDPGAYRGKRVHWAADADELAAYADVIVISVRPETWPKLDFDARGRLVISFMAGVTAEQLSRCGGRIVRAMPNAAAETGGSYSPFWVEAGVTEADRRVVRRVLSAIGTSDELGDETQIDVMTAVSGSGAAYPALMAVAMVDFMARHGIPAPIAWHAAEAAVCGGAAMLADAPERAQALLTTYLQYRGTTAAGLEAAERAGFSTALSKALEAATGKARAMAAEAPY